VSIALAAPGKSRPAPRVSVLFAALSGGVAAFGHAPFDLWLLTLIGLAGLFSLFARAASARQAALFLWAGGAGYFALTLNWIVEPFFVDAPSTGWMAPFALVLMAGGLALFWALAGWLAQRLMAQASAQARIAVLAGLLVLLEAARGVVFTGFPWAHPGHALIGSPLLPLAALVVSLLDDLGVVLDDVGQPGFGQNFIPEILGLEAIRVRRVSGPVVETFVEGEEPRVLALELRTHAHFLVVHRKVHHTAAELK
jgi:hypothetical protein